MIEARIHSDGIRDNRDFCGRGVRAQVRVLIAQEIDRVSPA
jgi:hypothetical protein